MAENNGTWSKSNNYYLYKIGDSEKFSISTDSFSFAEASSGTSLVSGSDKNWVINSTTSTVTIVNAGIFGYNDIEIKSPTGDHQWKFTFSDTSTASSTALTGSEYAWDSSGTNIAALYTAGDTARYSLDGVANTSSSTKIVQDWVGTPEVVLKGVQNITSDLAVVSTEHLVTFKVNNIKTPTDGVSIQTAAAGYGFKFDSNGTSSGTKVVIIDSDTFVTGTDNADTITTAFSDTTNGYISIDGGGGNDIITASGVTITKASSIFGGAGDDQITFSDATVSETFNINGGTGSDTFTIKSVTVASGKNLEIDGGTGNDSSTFTIQDISVAGGLKVSGTGADDIFTLNNVSGTGTVSLIGGAGSDTFTINVGGAGKVNIDATDGNDTFIISSSTAVTIVSKDDDSDTLKLNMTAGNIGVNLSNFNKDDIISLSSAATSASIDSTTGTITFEVGTNKATLILGKVENKTALEDLYKMKVYNGNETESLLGNIVDPYVWNSSTGVGGTYTAIYGRHNSVSDTSNASAIFSITGLASATKVGNTIAGLELNSTNSTVTISSATLLGESTVTITNGYKFAIEGTLSNTSKAALWTYSDSQAGVSTINASLASAGTKLNYTYGNEESTTVIFTPETSAFVIGGINSATKLTAVDAGGTIGISSTAYVASTPMKITKNDGYSVSLGGASMLEVSAFASGTSIIGSSGADTITASGTTTVASSIFGGAGNDSIVIEGLTFSGNGELYVSGDSGTDVFDITGINASGKLVVDGGAGDDTFNISSVVGGGYLVLNGDEGKDTFNITNSTGISIVSENGDTDTFVFDGASAASASISNFDTTDIFKFTTAVTSGSVTANNAIQFTTTDGKAINVTLDGLTNVSEVYKAKVYNGSNDSVVTALEDIVAPYIWKADKGTLTYARRTNTSDSLFAVVGLNTSLTVDSENNSVAGVTLNAADSTVTIAQSALTTGDVSITTDLGYDLRLDTGVVAPTASDAVWSVANDVTALYIAPMYASIAGYETLTAAKDSDGNGTSDTYIHYYSAETPVPMASISGLGATGLNVSSLKAATNGAYITLNDAMLSDAESVVAITNADGHSYSLKLAADAKTSTTDASWSVKSSKDVVVYTAESVKGGWKLDEDSIKKVNNEGGDKVTISGLYNAKLNAKKTVNGVTYDSETNTFIISNDLLNNTLHTASVTGANASVIASISAKDGVTGNDDASYKVSIAADVPSYKDTRSGYWDSKVDSKIYTANYYTGTGSIAGYAVSSDGKGIEFKAAQHPDVTISLAGLSNKATVKNDNISGLTVNSETSTVKIAANLVGTNGASITTSVKDYTYTLAGKGKLINAQDKAVTLQGSSSNDTLQNSGTAAVLLEGGKGNDAIIANGKDSVDMGAGNDAVTLAGGNNTVIYTAGKDVINGFTATDSIDIGDKTVKESTYNGNALTLTIGTGSLTFNKAESTSVKAGDNIYYQNFVYTSDQKAVSVGAGYATTTLTLSSLASGVASIDASKVAKGLNISLNSANALTITGTKKNDTITGGTGKDTLNGGDGNDVIYGGDGDSLFGGKGNDTFVYTGGNVTITDFDAKKDKISLSGGSASVSVTNATSDGSNLVLTLSNNNKISLEGVSGNPAITINNTAVIFGDNYIIDGKKTSATLNSGAASFDANKYSSMVSINGGTATSNLTITGNSKANKITGGTGNDTLNGGKGNDTLTGGKGADTFVYAVGEGKDVIADFSIADKDVLSISGGSVADIKASTYNDGNLALTIGKQAVTLQGSLSSSQQISINGAGYYFGENQIFDSGKAATSLYSAFKGSYDATADTKVATIDGSGVNSAVNITGNTIANSIVGGKKNDTFNGGAGADTIDGGAGNDSIYGGAGNDSLYGGAGKDVFAFKANEGTDTIADYKAGQDKIQFLEDSEDVTWTINGSDVVFTYGNGGKITATGAAGQKITTIDSTGKATTKKYDQATYTKTKGELYYKASSASSKTFDLFEDNNFITDDTNLDSITDNKVAVTQLQDNKDEFTQTQDLLTYSDDK